tara:strand:+ start:42163 stop:42294 length:132 start_codon:yes stop_codon:yes gene_type:complete
MNLISIKRNEEEALRVLQVEQSVKKYFIRQGFEKEEKQIGFSD